MSDEGKLDEKVLGWLRTQGYPLEFKTAEILQELEFGVRQGSHYRDGEEAPREIDVVGEMSQRQDDSFIRVSHYIECKWSKQNPWVVFTSENSVMSSAACIAQTQGNDVARAILWSLAGNKELHKSSIFHAPRRAGFGGRQAFKNDGKDQVYIALQGIVNAVQSKMKTSLSRVSDVEEELRYIEIGLPLIVIEGNLFEAYWDKSAEGMKVEPRNHLRIHWQGSAAWQLRASIDIVTIEGLSVFLAQRRDEIRALLPRMFDTVQQLRSCIRDKSMNPLAIIPASRGYLGKPAFLRRLHDQIMASYPPSLAAQRPEDDPPGVR